MLLVSEPLVAIVAILILTCFVYAAVRWIFASAQVWLDVARYHQLVCLIGLSQAACVLAVLLSEWFLVVDVTVADGGGWDGLGLGLLTAVLSPLALACFAWACLYLVAPQALLVIRGGSGVRARQGPFAPEPAETGNSPAGRCRSGGGICVALVAAVVYLAGGLLLESRIRHALYADLAQAADVRESRVLLTVSVFAGVVLAMSAAVAIISVIVMQLSGRTGAILAQAGISVILFAELAVPATMLLWALAGGWRRTFTLNTLTSGAPVAMRILGPLCAAVVLVAMPSASLTYAVIRPERRKDRDRHRQVSRRHGFIAGGITATAVAIVLACSVIGLVRTDSLVANGAGQGPSLADLLQVIGGPRHGHATEASCHAILLASTGVSAGSDIGGGFWAWQVKGLVAGERSADPVLRKMADVGRTGFDQADAEVSAGALQQMQNYCDAIEEMGPAPQL